MNEVTIGNMPTLPYAVEEAVNRLRINISFLGSDIKKKIMVISTMPDEGKSFVTMQLLASDGRIRNTVDPVRCRPS